MVRCRSLDPRCKFALITLLTILFTPHLRLQCHPTHINKSRYATLGPHWSATMLSLIEFAMVSWNSAR